MYAVLTCLLVVPVSYAQIGPQLPERQPPRNVTALALGQSRDEVLGEMGQPEGVYSYYFSKYYPLAERSSVIDASGRPVVDVFTRTLGGIEFEIRAAYAIDSVTSRLHPTERVVRVEFIPDKNLPFWGLVGLVPQAKVLCAADCSMLGDTMGYSYYVYIYPRSASADQMNSAAAVASGFGPSRAPAGYVPLPCIKISFQEQRGVSDRSPFPEFNSLTVDEITLDVCDPAFEKRMALDGVKELFHLRIP